MYKAIKEEVNIHGSGFNFPSVLDLSLLVFVEI